MGADRWRNIAWMVAVVTATAILLSLIWRVPYLYTLIGAATWSFVGHIITADDDMAGGWSNPDGSLPFPWRALLANATFLAGLIAVAVIFPSIRALGGD